MQRLVFVPEESTETSEIHKTPDGEWKIDVRADGCVHIKRFHNGSRRDSFNNPDMDYLHVCDFDGFAAVINALERETLGFRGSM